MAQTLDHLNHQRIATIEASRPDELGFTEKWPLVPVIVLDDGTRIAAARNNKLQQPGELIVLDHEGNRTMLSVRVIFEEIPCP